jgi:hypothetical protein
MNDTTYLIHLDGRLLTEGRERNQDAFKYQDPAPARVLLQEWINKTAFHWTGIDLTLRYSGPVPDLGNPQKRFFATRATLAAELAVSTRLHFLQNADNSAFAASSEYNYLSRFDDTVNELLSLLEIMVNRLRQRVSELDVPETSRPYYRDDTRGVALKGRLENLTYARHLCDLARSVCSIHGRYEHPKYNDWLKLTAVVERNFSAAIIDRAKYLEAFRNERIEGTKKSD